MAHVKGHEKGKVQKKKKSKPLTKRIYTGGIFTGHGKISKKYKKMEKERRVKYRKDKKAIKEGTDWDNTNEERLDKLLDKYTDDLDRIENQKDKDRDLIKDYGLRGARSRSFMTERGGGTVLKRAGGGGTKKRIAKTISKKLTPTKKKKPKVSVGHSSTFPYGVPLTAKKHGGKISYKMSGGQVVDAGYD